MSLRVRSLQFQALSSRGLPLPMLPLASSSPAHPGNAPESCPPRTGSRAQRRCPPRDPARQESPFLCAHGHGRHSPRPCPQGPSHSCFCGQAPATVSGVPRGPLPGPLRAAPPSGSLRWRRHQHPRFLLPTAASGNLRFSHRAPHDTSGPGSGRPRAQVGRQSLCCWSQARELLLLAQPLLGSAPGLRVLTGHVLRPQNRPTRALWLILKTRSLPVAALTEPT